MALIYDSKTDTVSQASDTPLDQDEDWRDRGGRGTYDPALIPDQPTDWRDRGGRGSYDTALFPAEPTDWRDRGGRGSYDNTGGISDTAQAQAARKIREGNRGFIELLSAYTILNFLSRLLGRRSFDDWFQEPYTP